MQSEAALIQSLRTLDLLSPSDGSPISPSTCNSLVYTIAEELDGTFQTSSTSIPLEPALEPLLRRLGYTGDATSRLPVMTFLFSTLRAHRILTLRNTKSKPQPPARDVMLAAAVLRLQAALPHPQRNAPESAAHLAALLKSLRLAAEKRVAAAGGCDAAMGKLLLDGEAVTRKRQMCETVRGELAREQQLRKRMLLHQLDVTVQARGRGERADKAAFEGMMERVRKEAAEEGDVSVFEAVVAREWVLRMERGSGDEGKGVKSVVMGAVPDRGGRVGREVRVGRRCTGFRREWLGEGEGRREASRRGRLGETKRQGGAFVAVNFMLRLASSRTQIENEAPR